METEMKASPKGERFPSKGNTKKKIQGTHSPVKTIPFSCGLFITCMRTSFRALFFFSLGKRRPTHQNIAAYWFPIWQVYRLQPSPRLVCEVTWQVRSLNSSRGPREVVGWEHTIAKLLKHQIGSEKGQWRMCHIKNRQRERLSARNTHSCLSALRERHTVIAQGSECSHAHNPACWNPTPNALVLRCGMDKEMELVSFS